MEIITEVFKHTLLITFFVFSMMIMLDYLTIFFKNSLDLQLKNTSSQYFFSSFLGIIPGCLGSFFNVSLYLRGLISFGALTGAMIATSGDEAFVMLAMFPKQALLLFAILFILGIISGWLIDRIPYLNKGHIDKCSFVAIHKQDLCSCFDAKALIKEWRNLSFIRFFLTITTIGLLLLLLMNQIGPEVWNWKKYSLVILATFTAFVVTTVPEHYLNIHIWEHIFKKHIWKIFFWTFFALMITHLSLEHFDLTTIVSGHLFKVFVIAIIIGLIPESGPHLIFVTLFAQGVIPFSILLASSIVQDGHGILPLLSHSVGDVVKIKFINALFALIIGGAFLISGF